MQKTSDRMLVVALLQPLFILYSSFVIRFPSSMRMRISGELKCINSRHLRRGGSRLDRSRIGIR
jgi:hypothetical protein